MLITDYLKKPILAWLSYNENFGDFSVRENIVKNKRVYVNPRMLVQDNANYLPINPQDFPTRGGIEVHIIGDETAEEVYDRVGPLVIIILNERPQVNPNSKNLYSLKYSYIHGRNKSEIWIEAFTPRGLYQVVDAPFEPATLLQDRKILLGNDVVFYSTQILLRNKTDILGPFEYDIKEDTLFLRGTKDFHYLVGTYEAAKYQPELLQIKGEFDSQLIQFLPTNLLPPPAKSKKSYDWILRDKLLDTFIEALQTHAQITPDSFACIKDATNKILRSSDTNSLSKERLDRIRHWLKEMSSQDDTIREVAEFASHLPQTQSLLNAPSTTKKLAPDATALQAQIESLKADKLKLEKALKAYEKSSSKAEQNAKTSAASSHGASDAMPANLEAMLSAYEDAKKKYEQLVLQNQSLEAQCNETLAQFNDQAKQTAELLHHQLLDRILQQNFAAASPSPIPPFNPSILQPATADATVIIEQVWAFLSEQAHRQVSYNDVANYLICLTQGFMTTFAGEPGTGKTSLCNLLAKALGLDATPPNKRFVDISVERGWSSHKDFIGYYNPLTKAMEKSNLDVFQAFEQMQSEIQCSPDQIAPYLILLDEANLSPIEHYWAAFLRNCDFSSVSNRSITMGGNQTFKLPLHLRFLATVNFDHTTEELSPRFLDRSWVIMLEPTSIGDAPNDDVENVPQMLPYADLMNAFSIRPDDSLEEGIQTKWEAIQAIFREATLQIMPRNQKMVKNYCAVACRCMQHDTTTTKMAPLDYAFSQKILPTINGTGEHYRFLMENLMKECTAQNMPISARHLERMKRIAERNADYYQFFSR